MRFPRAGRRARVRTLIQEHPWRAVFGALLVGGATVGAGVAGASVLGSIASTQGPQIVAPTLTTQTAGAGLPVAIEVIAADAHGVAFAEVSIDGGPWLRMAPRETPGGRRLVSAELLADPIQAIAIGSAHACALRRDGAQGGTVRCQGAGWSGQLGNGTTLDTAVPAEVTGITNALAIAAGDNHTCALLMDGTIECWGAGDRGQLGDGRSQSSAVPVATARIQGAIAISAGGNRTCALLASGEVDCWGDGTPTPTKVEGADGAIAITVGATHACAALGDGSVACWGANVSGQLGSGKADAAAHPTAELVGNLEGVRTIAAGARHTCAVNGDGAAYCWGANGDGQLGSGKTDAKPHGPIPVGDGGTVLTGVAGIAAGATHTCALMVGGTVRCWGSGAAGQLGAGASGTASGQSGFVARGVVAKPVPGVQGATAITAAANRTCATIGAAADAEGPVIRCWGDDGWTRLTNGTGGWTAAGVTAAIDAAIGPATLAGITGTIADGPHEVCARATSITGVTGATACATLQVGVSTALQPSPSPSPVPTPSPQPTPTPTPSPTAPPEPTATPSPTTTPAPTLTARPDGKQVASLTQAFQANGKAAAGAQITVKPGATVETRVASTPALGGQTARLQRRVPGGTWVQIVVVRLGAAGTAKYSWQAYRASASYRWSFAGTATWASATSQIIDILVAP
jgi:alpha-tubulin suppressor-like RCC1 family protein